MGWAETAQASELALCRHFADGPATITQGAAAAVDWPDLDIEDVAESDVPASLAGSATARIHFPRAGAPVTPRRGDKITAIRGGVSREFRLLQLDDDEPGAWVFLAGGGR